MTTHRAPPNPAHQALLLDLQATVARYQSMHAMERVAVIAQFLGAEIAFVPRGLKSQDIMQAVAANMAAGNGTAGGQVIVAESTGGPA